MFNCIGQIHISACIRFEGFAPSSNPMAIENARISNQDAPDWAKWCIGLLK